MKDSFLEYALQAAGDNRKELEAVLDHYSADPEKYEAARFLIENMPAHTSYDCLKLDCYYELAEQMFLENRLSPPQQSDSLRNWCDRYLSDLSDYQVPDVRAVKADYLIYSIDHAFEQWKKRPWSGHVTFDEFCEWLLPYKAVENQKLDYWRDTLSLLFSDGIGKLVPDDVEYETAFRTVDVVRNELIDKIHMYGLYDRGGYPVLSASGIARQTFGRCTDYVTLAVLTYRSLGLPAIIDEVPYWGRFRAGHTWYCILADRGQQLPAEWDLGSVPGWGFFPYERIPKVYRNTWAVNRERVRYMNDAKYPYPFKLCQQDVTAQYTRTANPEIPITKGGRLRDKYAFISIFNGHFGEWSVVDYGRIRKGRACFRDIGVNVLYCAFGVGDSTLVPVSDPFILEKDGSVRYIRPDLENRTSVDIRRKYPQSVNVVDMRRRLSGGRVQCADRPDFSDARTVLEITDVLIPAWIPLSAGEHRYWRYLGADGTHGSIAELAFLDADTAKIAGRAISCAGAAPDAVRNAFDGDMLTNFETDGADGAWVGMDMGRRTAVSFVRIVPRSDDNDICPGDTYDFRYWDGDGWVTTPKFVATDNVLHFDAVPEGTLMWVRDYTRGWDERPFMIGSDGSVEWR